MQNEHFTYIFLPWNDFFLLEMLSGSDDEIPSPESEEKHPPRGDQPHLRFEISSDDGFIVEADSIEGKIWLYATF